MLSNEIIGLMRGTTPYSNVTLSYLSNLLGKYPYFQTAHLLNTLNLFHLQNSQFLIDLRRTAVYVQDRKQLFFRVENSFFDPQQIDTFEDEKYQIQSSFDLIDNFLSDNVEETEIENFELDYSPISKDYVSSYSLPEIEDNEKAPRLKHQDTIDRFLAKDALSPVKIKLDRVEKQKVEPPAQVTLKRNDKNYYTETLAKIYIKQKKYDKALEVIHKLNLIYPEKSSYFADQIRFLEKLVTNKNKNK